jgi:hypothetical protein
MENIKCLVCGNDHGDGGNLPCHNYKFIDFNTADIGDDNKKWLYESNFTDLVELPDDVRSSKDFIKWLREE